MADEQAQNDTPSRQSGGGAGQGGSPSAESKPQIGDSRPAPKIGDSRPAPQGNGGNGDQGNQNRQNGGDGAQNQGGDGQPKKRRRRRGGRGRGRGGQGGGGQNQNGQNQNNRGGQQKQGGRPAPVEAITSGDAVELDEKTLKRRRGRTRKGKAVGRYLMCVHVGPKATQIATLEGRKLVEHQVSRPADDISQIHGNIYLGRVQNVLPGMEAAFVDIATPKNAVLYAGDVQYDADDLDSGGKGEKRGGKQPRIEDVLKAKQSILTQVTKNPIAHKGARLTQEVSLPGRFVVLVPNSSTYGIS
ncbi:MAG: hypothetical protein VWZ83_08200, partial [Acidimicrobiaceae bacterium]